LTNHSPSDRAAWALDPGVVFLNHGSYGACPRAVMSWQSELRAQLEADPVHFFRRRYETLLDDARIVLAAFVGAHPEDLVFVPNATTGINSVLRSLELRSGDELVITNHAYGACLNAVRFVAQSAGASVVVAKIGFPPSDHGEIQTAVLGAVGPRTRLVLLDQVTSPTSLVFPVASLVAALESQGIPVLVDAAHAPGMIPMSIDQVGASFTAGNLHKWVCAPKGAGFLHVRRDRQALVRPTVISHGASAQRTGWSRFQLEFDWVGTIDPTPYLCVPRALDFMSSLHAEGWGGVMRANHEAAQAGAALLNARIPQARAPIVEGAMASLVLPGQAEAASELQDQLYFQYRIEVPIIPFEGLRLIRISMQRHTALEAVETLVEALGAIL
jgi:isopenicillin-N epimerase